MENKALQQLPTSRLVNIGAADFMQHLKVLIVDDDFPTCRLLVNQVKARGCCAKYALNGQEALRWIAQEDIHLVLTDCQMQGMSGFDLARIIRRQYPERRTRIIGLTASLCEGRAWQRNFDDMDQCFIKPLSQPKLGRLLERVAKDIVGIYLPPNKAQALLVAPLYQPQLKEQEDFLRAVWHTNVEDMKALSVAVEEKNSISIAHLAHKLRGVAIVAGRQDVVDTASELENICHYPFREECLQRSVSNLCESLTVFNEEIVIQLRNVGGAGGNVDVQR